MRAAFAALSLLTLAACGEAPAPEANATEPALLTGQFNAASNTARAITGDASIERGGVLFASGVVLFTRTLEPRRGEDVISRDGDSYAAAALGPGDLTIELRRVTEQTVPAGRTGLCGAEEVEYVALAYEARARKVTLLAFTGAEAPGPQATESRLCATFAFAAPEGARTREGVVL
ncbi:MAG TPA: hypothetical protein VEA80_08715 [Vitreimonas sp.]|uniref:hypothetical protein n=1 Tax=Vitreimonas sp. TaxID=3069702 RepID=UPI002D392BA2|nr:hypothetical protein [Vitreimonas sp.]HYD87541.1 hypothetical protein [Vitreimonas sp.]